MVTECLRKMKECFASCQRECHKLEVAIEKYFNNGNYAGGRIGGEGVDDGGDLPGGNYRVITAAFSQCGVCDGMMDMVQSNGGDRQRYS